MDYNNNLKLIEFIDSNKINLQKNSFYLLSMDKLEDLVCLNVYFKKKEMIGKFCKKNNKILFFMFDNNEWKYIDEFGFARGIGGILFDNGLINNLEMAKIEKILRDFILFNF